MAWAVTKEWVKTVPEAPDVTIRFDYPRLHSKVLNSYSGYFKTWSKRWNGSTSVMSLPPQSKDCYHADCFSRMYSLYAKNFDFGLRDFGDIKYCLELLKVACLIEFNDLIDSILLSLSTRFWSKEDEERIREYSSSEDFPRSRAEDLVHRLGLKVSKDDRYRQSHNMLLHLVLTALDPKMLYDHTGNQRESVGCRSYRYILKSVVRDNVYANATPSNLGRTVIGMLTREAKTMLDKLNLECEKKTTNFLPSGSDRPSCKSRILAMCFALKILVASKVADTKVIKSFVHSKAISSRCCEEICGSGNLECLSKKLTGLVLLICQEMVDGRLPFGSAERKAVLANWHPLLELYIEQGKDSTHSGKLKQVTSKLFSTLSFQDQTEVLKHTIPESLPQHRLVADSWP